jgi:hypothetical protein
MLSGPLRRSHLNQGWPLTSYVLGVRERVEWDLKYFDDLCVSCKRQPCGGSHKFLYCTSGDGAIWSGRGTIGRRPCPHSVLQGESRL